MNTSKASYTVQAIAEDAAFLDMRRDDPEKKPTTPRSWTSVLFLLDPKYWVPVGGTSKAGQERVGGEELTLYILATAFRIVGCSIGWTCIRVYHKYQPESAD
jgi:hypothetical protein